MPRYVVLEHDYPVLHWDFMLESGQVLRTWRLAAPPQLGKAVVATAISDHRLGYLDYEGPVSGNRGRVTRWDHGTFSWQKLESDHVAMRMSGGRVRGTIVLERADADAWTLTLVD
jgi:hypothetical protein